MADVERSVKIAFEGDDRISPVIDTINGKIEGFASSVQGVTTPLADMAEGILKVETAFAALAGAGIVYAISKSIEFENATIELQKVIGDEAGRIDEAKAKAIELSETYGESSSKILSAMADWVQAGYNLDDSMTLTKNSLDLVIAGQLNAGEAADYLIGILAGFKAPASEAAHIIDVLNGVSNLYATDVKQLAIGMQELSPIARLMGMSFEQTAGLLTPVIEVFRDGGEAAEALKTGLARIVDDRKPTLDTLAAIGVSQKDVNGQLRSGYDILLDVAKAFQGLSPEMQFYHAQNLVGIDQAARMVTALSALDNVMKVTADAYNTQGSALAEVAIRLQSAQVAVNQFKEGFVNLGIAIGDQFKIAATSAIQGGTAIEQALRDAVKAGTFQPVFDIIKDFGSKIGTDLKQIAAALPEALSNIDWSKFRDSVGSIGEALKGLFIAAFGDIDLTTANGLQIAIEKVLGGITLLNNVVAGILQSWKPFVEGLAKAAEEFTKMSPEAQKTAGGVLGFGQAIDKILNQVGVFTGGIEFLGKAMMFLGITQIPATITGLASLVPWITSAAASLGPFGAIAAAVGTGWVLDKVLTATVPGFESLKGALADNISMLTGASDGMGEWAESTENAGVQAVETTSGVRALVAQIEAVPEEKTVTVETEGTALTKEELDGVVKAFAAIGDKKEIAVTAKADEAQIGTEIGKVGNIILTELPDGVVVLTQTKPDTGSITATKDAINKDLPSEKIMEIMLKGDIDTQLATIKANADTVQKALEWKAKVDIAEIEAMAKTLQELSKNTAEMFKSAGDTLVGLSGALSGVYAPDILDLMKAEQAIQQQLATSQIAMNTAQISYIKARTDALNKGAAMVTISAEGLAPELELVLHKIVQLTQIKANEEGLAFLLGVT